MTDIGGSTNASPGQPDEFRGDASSDSNNGYDLTRFYTSARDKKGFTTTVRTSIPPSVMHRISAVVAKGTIPEYQTSGDVLRDALVHRLQWLGEHEGEIELTEAARVLMAETRSQAFLSRVEAATSAIKNYERALRSAARKDQLEILGAVREDLRDSRDTTLIEGLQGIIRHYE